MKKSIISLLLAVLMVFGMFPLSAFAAGTDTAYTADEDSEVQDAEAGENSEPPEADEVDVPVKADADIADTGAYTITGPIGITGVTEPQNGRYPSYTGISVLNSTEYKINTSYTAGSYKNGIMWKDEDSNYIDPSNPPAFQAGKKYSVVAFIVPASSNYVFDKNAIKSKTNTVNGKAASKVGFWDDDEMYIEYQFTAYGTLSYVYANIAAPRPGESPSYSATVGDSDRYYATGTDTGTLSAWKNGVKWRKSDGTDISYNANYKFVAGETYTVFIALKPKGNWKFASKSNMSADINGSSAYVDEWETGSYIYIWRRFTCTNTVVSTVTSSVTAPVIGAKPDTSGSTGNSSYYISSVKWLDADNSYSTMYSSDTFKAGHRYQACVFARANTGYCFKTSGSDPAVSGYVNGNAATAITKIGGTDPDQGVCVKYTFPALKATVIGAASVNVTAPVIGAKVSKTATVSSGYTGYTVANMYWYNLTDGNYPSESDKFLENKEYRCFVEITANTGYEFKNSSGSPTVTGYVNGKSATVTKAGTSYSAAERVTLIYTYPKMTKETISTVATTITGPSYGKAPSYVASAASSPVYEIYKMNYQNFKDGVCWIDDTSNKTVSPSDTSFKFIAGHRYTVQIMVKVKNSDTHKFASTVNGSINGSSAVVSGYGTLDKDVYRIMANSFLCSGGTEISSVATTITAPVIGKTPDFEGGVSTTGVRVSSIIWYDLTDSKYIYQNDAFLENHKYDACIVLRTNDDGYYFKNENGTKTKVTGTLNGSTAQTASYASNSVVNCICVNYEFSELTYTSISKIGISGVTPPVAGLAPLYVVPNTSESTKYVVYKELNDSVRYSGGQCWWDKTANKAVNPTDKTYKFIAGHEYQYQVMVYTLPGYKFAAKVSSTINGSAAVTYTKNGYSSDFYRCVYIDFPAATATISSAAAEVTAPVAGQSRAYSATANGNGYKVDTSVNYSGVRNGVSWYKDGTLLDANNSEKFIEGVKYKVRVFLAAENDYYTLASYLTGKINGNNAAVYSVTAGKKIYLEYEFTCAAATGNMLNVKVTSSLKAEQITVTLKQGSKVIDTKSAPSAAGTKTETTVTFPSVAPGNYTVVVHKNDHVDREYTLTMGPAATMTAEICPKGDVNGDGTTDIMDCSLAQRYIRELTALDPYQISCGDVSGSGDGELDIQDVSRILRHIRELDLLY